jgi:hypothetical protein
MEIMWRWEGGDTRDPLTDAVSTVNPPLARATRREAHTVVADTTEEELVY